MPAGDSCLISLHCPILIVMHAVCLPPRSPSAVLRQQAAQAAAGGRWDPAQVGERGGLRRGREEGRKGLS